ncbi:3-oxoacyl-[acyl-carrier-protein] synthase II [Parafrankia irregularis]|uniref:3-oxoacyl-[acyl-carrier-protein] synthase II n=1 Tax=Parafrankia irregularis TaxID=795642 RepID=A0A0S4QR83_9ACTN|nr:MULTISPECIES: beta-ketoacyl-[acyl-carrier-protein] synthase family protein [Parafrankia]CUU56918.1 3-oxoacyl-[acyl-carrier-protein] synthase II [Parafrankia irregularis]
MTSYSPQEMTSSDESEYSDDTDGTGNRGRGGGGRQVVVTGVGLTTPLGGDVADSWAGVLAGRSGVRALTAPWASELPVRIAAPVAVEPPLARVEARSLDRGQQLAVVAAREAWADAGDPALEPERLAVVIGSGVGGVTTLLSQSDIFRDRGHRRVSPFLVPMIMPNGPASAVGLALGARAGVHAPVSACASGAEAIAYALDLIQLGRADVVVAGGTEAAVHPLPLTGFAQMQALSRRNDDPGSASRPFDKSRDGFVLGEGAGVLVLEAAEHAAARGARVLATLGGAGISSDAHHVAAPDPTGAGAARAIRHALTAAGIGPADVVHVNAHASATPAGDVAESRGLRAALGPALDGVAVTSTKSMTGHLLGASGAVEAVFAVLSLRDGLAPATRNLTSLDDEIHLDVVAVDNRPLRPGAVLSTSFGFGGHDVCLVFVR